MKPPKIGLLLKYGISLVVLILIMSSMLTFFIILQERVRISGDLKDKGYLIAKNLSYSAQFGVQKNDKKYLKLVLSALKDEYDVVFAQIINSRGQMLAEAYKQKSIKTSVYTVDVPIESPTTNDTTGEAALKYAGVIGQVKIGISLAKVEDATNQILNIVFGITLGISLLGIVGTFILTKYFLARPLKEFVDGTHRISRGDLAHRIKISSADEIGELADSFNQMAEDLKKINEQLQSHAKNLETKVKERTKELEAALDKLKVVDRMKTEFLSVVSHELKTPLTPIHEYTSLLLEGVLGHVSEEQKKALETVKRQSTHLSNLMDTVLDISRLEVGKPFPIKKELISFSDILNEIKEAVGADIKKSNLSFEAEIAQNLPTIYADGNAIRRLFLNLIGNAVKFTPHSGKITIKIVPEDHSILCSVSDTGIGLSKEHLEKIFEKFYQVDSSYTREAGGLGMGLAIARGIVEAHGGKIWAESKGLGWGSTFYFRLPLV